MELLAFLTLWQITALGHLLGAILGGGAAFTSDFVFVSTIRDGQISHDEMRFLKLISGVVWLGLGVLLLTGAGFFLQDSQVILGSEKILAKLTIVAIILINGIIFHVLHLPRLQGLAGQGREWFVSWLDSPQGRSMFLSGAVSGVSWLSVILLGALRSVPYGYWALIGLYIMALAGALGTGLIVYRIKLKKFKSLVAQDQANGN